MAWEKPAEDGWEPCYPHADPDEATDPGLSLAQPCLLGHLGNELVTVRSPYLSLSLYTAPFFV